MAKENKNSLKVKKNKREEFLDAILGPDEDMTDEAASEILAQYGIDETKLVDDFKESIKTRLGQISAESDESKNLGALLRDIVKIPKSFLLGIDVAERLDNWTFG